VHGWRGSKGLWIADLKDKFLKHRGGCVVTFDWGFYSDDVNYVKVVEHNFEVASDLLLNRLKILETSGYNMRQVLLYGHSLGAHMSVNAALKLGKCKIGMIDGEFAIINN
jgi:pimeloyl-ACP methyl ester carboxylesterase